MHALIQLGLCLRVRASVCTQVSFGALGDSYYEYLLKLWVLKGRPQGHFLREMWEQVGGKARRGCGGRGWRCRI